MRHPFRTLSLALLLAAPAAAQDLTLEYSARYDKQPGADHLIDVLAIDDRRALVASNLGVALIDLTTLPAAGSSATLSLVEDIHVRNLYRLNDDFVIANLFGGVCDTGVCGPGGSPGFAILKLEGDTLRLIRTIEERSAFFEKMAISGSLLYVPAHVKGLRVYDLSQPEAFPIPLVGRLDEGFVDAWAVAVDGTTAYVADGAGGLKFVDVSDPANPRLVGGETLASAVGFAQDVLVRNGRIYLATGGPGVAVYSGKSLATRELHRVGSFAKDLDWLEGGLLAVATYDGFSILRPTRVGTGLEFVVGETSQRRGASAALRICSAVGAGPSGRVMAANWDYMDVYELKPVAAGTQPDIELSIQRIRFHPLGGTQPVTLRNNGRAPLVVSNVSTSLPTFTTSWTGGTLAPGEVVNFDVAYLGSDTTQGTAQLRITSNDPDEGTVVMRIFGNTTFLDPGDPVPDFTRPTIEKDPQGQIANGSWTLSDHRNRITWFTIFSSW